MVNFSWGLGSGFCLLSSWNVVKQTLKPNLNMENMIFFGNLALAELEMPGCKNNFLTEA